MADLSTRYLGLNLKNPLVPSSSPLTLDVDKARKLEDAGAAALIMHSLFEEKVEAVPPGFPAARENDADRSGRDSSTRYQDDYLAQVQVLKRALEIPIIASFNGTTVDTWLDHAVSAARAGADALELNVYFLPVSLRESAAQVEARYLELLAAVVARVDIPVVMKLSPQFSSLAHTVSEMQQAGAAGVTLFNPFYQPDINVDTLETSTALQPCSSTDLLLRIRWLSILYGRVECSLGVTGGVREIEDVVKALLAGADVVHLCTVLLQRGPDYITRLLADLEQWLADHQYSSVRQIVGLISQRYATDSAAALRSSYMRILESHQ